MLIRVKVDLVFDSEAKLIVFAVPSSTVDKVKDALEDFILYRGGCTGLDMITKSVFENSLLQYVRRLSTDGVAELSKIGNSWRIILRKEG
jgi:hypothetical protein